MADRANRAIEPPELRDLALQHRRGKVLPHAGRVSSGQQQSIEVARSQVRPGNRRAKALRLGELRVEPLRLLVGPELAEDHPIEQPWISHRRFASPLSREHWVMTSVGQHPPGHRHLGDVEVPVRKGNQHAHASATVLQTNPSDPQRPSPSTHLTQNADLITGPHSLG